MDAREKLTSKLRVPKLELTRPCHVVILTDTQEMPILEQSVTQIKGIWLKVSAVVNTVQVYWSVLLSSEKQQGIQDFYDVSIFLLDFSG